MQMDALEFTYSPPVAVRITYRRPRYMKIAAATNIKQENKINSCALLSIAFIWATMITMTFPRETVNSQKLVTTDRMLGGA